jgi:gamma-glutamylputrescine oxidase
MQPYPQTYYSASAGIPPERPGLGGSVRCDAVVVGGGLAGCSAALELAERGFTVRLLEEHRVGWGASGRSGAQALWGTGAELPELERLVGLADARVIWQTSLDGLALIRERIARYRIDCGWVAGQMSVAEKPGQCRELERWQSTLRDRFGYAHTRLIEQDEVRTLIDSPLYRLALYDDACGHLHPLRYTLGLAAAAETAGAIVHEGTRALGFESGPQRSRVHTAQGDLDCEFLVLAGNATLGATAPPLQRSIATFRALMAATEPMGAERTGALIRNNAAITDTNWALNYYRRSADHRLIFGGGVAYSALPIPEIARRVHRRLLRVFPQLADVRLEYVWDGAIDITRNRAPNFGRLAPNVYYLQGFSGHGMALTGIAGRLVAEAIRGAAERFDVFARIPHRPFPGGPWLRTPLLALAMSWYQLRDLL